MAIFHFLSRLFSTIFAFHNEWKTVKKEMQSLSMKDYRKRRAEKYTSVQGSPTNCTPSRDIFVIGQYPLYIVKADALSRKYLRICRERELILTTVQGSYTYSLLERPWSVNG